MCISAQVCVQQELSPASAFAAVVVAFRGARVAANFSTLSRFTPLTRDCARGDRVAGGGRLFARDRSQGADAVPHASVPNHPPQPSQQIWTLAPRRPVRASRSGSNKCLWSHARIPHDVRPRRAPSHQDGRTFLNKETQQQVWNYIMNDCNGGGGQLLRSEFQQWFYPDLLAPPVVQFPSELRRSRFTCSCGLFIHVILTNIFL